MKKYQRSNPNNARIIIDFKKNNPVKFNYIKKDGVFLIVYSSLVGIWSGYFVIPLLLICFFLRVFFHIYSNLSFKVLAIAVFLPPLVWSFLFIKSKRMLSLMPQLNRIFSFLPLMNIKYKQIRKLNSKILEINLFKNYFLDFKATKEFSKYLVKVEITEYKFQYQIRNLIFKVKNFVNERLWKAKFYFSKIPRKGKLEVWFK